jgi:hypothetical protein
MAANGSRTRECAKGAAREFPASGEAAFTWDNDAKVAEEFDRKMGKSQSAPDFK